MLIDTHAHLQDAAFRDDLADVLRRGRDAGVRRVLVVGTTLDDSAAAVRMARAHPGLAAAVGVHPNEAGGVSADTFADELEALTREEEVVAVGETGLDFYRQHATAAQQESLLEVHLSVASRTGLPLIVHSRQSLDRLRDILKVWRSSISGGIMHCFPGGPDQARSFIDMGYLLGLGGTATYPRSRVPGLLKEVGLTHVVLETDCPYLAPVPKRGRRNEPAFLHYVVEHVASELCVPAEDIASTTTENARRLLRLNQPGSILPPPSDIGS